MIRVRRIDNPLELNSASVESVEWTPGLRARDLLPEGDEGPFAIWRDGELLDDAGEIRPLVDGDFVDVVRMPGIFGLAAAAGVAAGVIGGAAGTALAVAKITSVLVALGKLAAVAALNYAIGKILGPSERPLSAEDSDSATYRFGGITSNQNAEGAPIPVVYGKHDAGGLEIAKYSVVTTGGETLYILLALSEGPVYSVAGQTADADNLSITNGDLPSEININGQPATNFDDVEAWVRLGTDEQTAIPGFESAVVQYSVAQTITESNAPGPGNVELTPGVYTPGDPTDDAELNKWDTAVTYDLPAEADAFSAVLGLPSGLFTSGASIGPNSAKVQARYIELDGGGSPTGDYAVLPPETITGQTTSAFGTELRYDFVEPSTYSPPVPGLYANIPSGGAATASSISGWSPVAVEDVELSVSAWTDDPNETTYTHWHVSQVSGNFGFRARLRRQIIVLPGLSAGFGIQARIVDVEVFDGSTSATYTGTAQYVVGTLLNFPGGTNTHWGFAYRYNADKQLGELAIYIDGKLVKVHDTLALSPNFTAALSSTAPGSYGVTVDDLRVWDRKLSSGEFAGQYNSGTGAAINSAAAGLFLAVGFDTISAVQGADATSNGNDLVFSGGASVTGGNTGTVPAASTGTAQRARYRVEIQRLDGEDDDSLDQSQIDWDAIKAITFDEYRYPGVALLGLRIRASDQLNGGSPRITSEVEGRLCPVWDGTNAASPSYLDAFTRNPAWIALDALTNAEYGLGDYHDPTTDIDVAAFQHWADFCDTLVNTGEESFDVSDATSFAYLYSGGTVTLTYVGVTEFPVYEVGSYIAITGATGILANWNTDDDVGILLTDVDYTPSTDTLVLTGTWPSSQSAPTALNPSGVPGTEELVKREAAFLFDGVFDRPSADGWGSVVSIMQTARAKPVRYGKRVSVFVDRARDPVALVTMGNVVEGSFSTTYSGIKDRPNSIAIEILDRDKNYERRWVEREHSTLTDPANEENFRRRRIRREGVTRRSQALREAVYQLNVSFLLRRLVEFELDVDGLLLQPGDRIQVAHDIPQWGFSGRLRAGLSSTTFSLDRPFEIEAATTYEIVIQDASTGTTETRTITTTTGTYAAGSTLTVSSAFSFIPAAGDKYSIGEQAAATKDFAVTDVELNADTLRRKVQAIEYDAQVYDDDFGNILPSPSALDVPLADDQAPEPAFSVSAAEGNDENADGSLSTFIDVTWEPNPVNAPAWVGYEVWLQDNSTGLRRKVGTTTGRETTYRIAAAEVVRGGDYTVTVRAVSRSGRGLPVAASPSSGVTIRGLGDIPGRPTSLAARQVGDQVTYAWPGLPDRRGSEVHIRSGGWILGQRIGEALRGATVLGPTRSWMSAPTNAAGESNPTLFLRARSASGQWSTARTRSFDVEAPGEVLHEVIGEDTAGTPFSSLVFTRNNLANTPTLSDPTLELSSSNTSGYIQYDIPSLDAPEWVYLAVGYEAVQIDELTWEDATFAWGSVDGTGRTWEGSLLPDDASDLCTVRLSVSTTTDGTTPPVADLTLYDPGLYYFKDARVRATLNRPSTDKNIEFTRFWVRVIRPWAMHQCGTSFPSTPVEGQQFYRTDLEDWFYWDASRSKWLGQSLFEFSFFTVTVLGAGAYFLFDDNNLGSGATVGYVAAFDLCCVGLAGMDILSTTATRTVRDDGANTVSVSRTAASGGYSDMTLNSSTIAANSIISLNNTAGSSSASHHVAYFRRVAT